MSGTKSKSLVIHLDRFAGSGPVTKEQIIAAIEEVVPGATAGNKFKLQTIVRKKDGELIKVVVKFISSISNVLIEQIRQKILILAGVLEGGVGEQFPANAVECTDDFEGYGAADVAILENLGDAQWSMEALADPADANPPTFKTIDSLVSEGTYAGKLVLPVASTNENVTVRATASMPADAEKVELEADIGLGADPGSGAAMVEFGGPGSVIARLAIYGSRYFSLVGPKVHLNGKVVLYSKDPTGGEKEEVVGYARYGELFHVRMLADVDNPYFDFWINDTTGDVMTDTGAFANFKDNVYQLDPGLDSGSLLGVAVKALRSDTPNYTFDTAISTHGEDDFDLEAAGKIGTCIALNTTPPYAGLKKSYIDGGKASDFLNPDLAAFTFEMWYKALEDPDNPGHAVAAGWGHQLFNIGVIRKIGSHPPETGGMLLQFYPFIGTGKFRGVIYKDHVPAIDTNYVGADPAYVPGEWIHVAWTWDGALSRLFLNGVKRKESAFAGTLKAPTLRDSLLIGAERGYTHVPDTIYAGLHGHIDAVRISSIARYDVDFTPHTAPHTADGDTFKLWALDDANNKSSDGITTTAPIINSSGVDPSGAKPEVSVVVDDIKVTSDS